MLQLLQRIPSMLAHGAFIAFLILVFCTTSWRTGLFTWWPLWPSSVPYGQPAQIGVFTLLPILWAAAWGGEELARVRRRASAERQPLTWSWLAAAMMLPLLVLSLLLVFSLDLALTKRTIVQSIGLGLFWFSYLYLLHHRPRLLFPLLLIVVVQGSVAAAQFGLQKDLGLAFLGEYPLDLQTPGTSVLWNGEEVWLRGYGLTAHPNILAATLAVLLLMLLPQLRQRRGWQLAILVVGLAVGMLGLLVTFSRTGWLAFLGGALYWAFAGRDGAPSPPFSPAGQARPDAAGGKQKPFWTQRALWLSFVLVPVFLFFYHELILSRLIHLDTAIEARSIQERVRDAKVALALIRVHPWQGVGAGNGLEAAMAVRPDAGTVHNVALLVTAELGILGGVCWLLFMLLPLLPLGSLWPWRRMAAPCPLYRPAWVGLLIAGLFDTSLWLTGGWRAAILLGVLAALQGQSLDDGKEDAYE
jgi:O-antigen ligase